MAAPRTALPHYPKLGARLQTPDGPGTLVGYADYEYRRLTAGGLGRVGTDRGVYVWNAVDRATGELSSVVVEGYYIVRLDRPGPDKIRGYNFDELSPEGER